MPAAIVIASTPAQDAAWRRCQSVKFVGGKVKPS